MKTPDNVKINGIVYTIIAKRDFELRDNVGTTFAWQQEIHLNKESPPTQRASVLLHEILHAISHEYLGADEDLNETQVTGLTAGLRNVLVNCGINLIDMVSEGLE